MASGPIISWHIDGKQWKQWETISWGAPKSLQTLTAAMKLKDACSLEDKSMGSQRVRQDLATDHECSQITLFSELKKSRMTTI